VQFREREREKSHTKRTERERERETYDDERWEEQQRTRERGISERGTLLVYALFGFKKKVKKNEKEWKIFFFKG